MLDQIFLKLCLVLSFELLLNWESHLKVSCNSALLLVTSMVCALLLCLVVLMGVSLLLGLSESRFCPQQTLEVRNETWDGELLLLRTVLHRLLYLLILKYINASAPILDISPGIRKALNMNHRLKVPAAGSIYALLSIRVRHWLEGMALAKYVGLILLVDREVEA